MSSIFTKLLFLLAFVLAESSCGNGSLDPIPVVMIERNYRQEPFAFEDSTKIEQGLLYRKLSERNYREIYGLARFEFPGLEGDQKPTFDMLLLSCSNELEKVHLLISQNRKFKSVQDIFALNPVEQKILQIYPDPDAEGGLVVDLIHADHVAADAGALQLFKLAVNSAGKIEQSQ